MELTERVALVTGGGRRLGKAITEALAAAGCHVVVHYGRSGEAAAAAAAEIRRLGVESISVGADLSVPSQIDEMFARVEKRFGGLDILVNSAASFTKRPLLEIATEEWDAVMAVNLRAPWLCLRRAVPLMNGVGEARKSPGVVVNIADLSGLLPWAGYGHHGVSKAGLVHLTRVAARELAPEIRVNAVVPGPVLPPPGSSAASRDWQRLVDRLPAGRHGQPQEVGASVVFLARNDFIYGETLFVDGGEHLIGAGHRHL